MRKRAGAGPAAVMSARRKSLGKYIRRRRESLHLSRGDVTRMLGYKSTMSVADVELGRARLPLKRIYQYADILHLPRERFARFVIGEFQAPAGNGGNRSGRTTNAQLRLSNAERDVVEKFRRLPPKHRLRVRRQIAELLRPRPRSRSRSRTRR